MPHFTAELAEAAAEKLAASTGGSWKAVRSVGPELSPGEAALLATASGLVGWTLNHLYSGATGESFDLHA